MKNIVLIKFITVLALFSSFLLSCNQSQKTIESKQIVKDDKKYLYYLHGRIIEDMGANNAVSERFGKYEYKKILKTFEKKDFEVISEARPRNTDVNDYSTKLANEIKSKIKSGVSPENITVVGASKGSLIAMLTSTKLANKKVNFVLMGNCNDWILENFEVNLHGRILSIYEKTDSVGGNSCKKIKQNSKGIKEYKEIEINTGLDHGFLYEPLKEWIEPTIKWAKFTKK